MSLGRLIATALAGELRLTLQWDDGRSGQVDLRGVVGARAVLRPLSDPEVFAGARISDDGWSLEWPGAGIDFGAQQLRRWADEQAGEAMPLAAFREWLRRHDLAPAQAAAALGLAAHEVERYVSGEVPIPKTVMLATEGYDGRQAA
jgi:hypothetical protein